MVRNKQNTLRCVAALGLSGLAVVAQLYTQLPANAQAPAPAGAGGLVAILPVPLDTVPVPMPADLDIYIKDRAAAIKLAPMAVIATRLQSDQMPSLIMATQSTSSSSSTHTSHSRSSLSHLIPFPQRSAHRMTSLAARESSRQSLPVSLERQSMQESFNGIQSTPRRLSTPVR